MLILGGTGVPAPPETPEPLAARPASDSDDFLLDSTVARLDCLRSAGSGTLSLPTTRVSDWMSTCAGVLVNSARGDVYACSGGGGGKDVDAEDAEVEDEGGPEPCT